MAAEPAEQIACDVAQFMTCDISKLSHEGLAQLVLAGEGLSRSLEARQREVVGRGCVFPGCDRPPSWCDIHHCTPGSEGGDTALDNGALLCRAHHSFVHRYGWTVVIPPAAGTPEIYRSDASLFTIGRHPPARERLLEPNRATAA
jgi:hypothetical protein